MTDHQLILDDLLLWRLHETASIWVYLVLFDDLLVFFNAEDFGLQILCYHEVFFDDIIDRHEPLLSLSDVVISSHPDPVGRYRLEFVS